MSKKLYPHTPDWFTPPGETLLEVIEFKGISQKDLADRTGVTPKHINKIITGEAAITPEMAILLERATGTSAITWNRLEANFQARKATAESKKKLLDDRQILKNPTIKELIHRHAIVSYDDTSEQIEAVLGFYGVGSVKKLKERWQIPHQAALRHSPSFESNPVALATWLQLGEKMAEKIECQPFDKGRFLDALTAVRKLTVKHPSEFVPEMRRFCANAGVAVVFVKEFRGAAVHGAAKWMTPQKAVIILNLRGKKNDLFWFSFFHEAAHVIFDSKKGLAVDVFGKTEANESERRADDFASRNLIPEEYNSKLFTLKSKNDVLTFAKRLGISPGIVVGRLQYEKIIPFTNLNDLKETFVWQEGDF
jgi:addiction module HigA family antidote